MYIYVCIVHTHSIQAYWTDGVDNKTLIVIYDDMRLFDLLMPDGSSNDNKTKFFFNVLFHFDYVNFYLSKG